MTEFSSPYSHTLGLTVSRESGELVVTMRPGGGVEGRQGFLHGGAIAGLLEYAAWATLTAALGEGSSIKPISITVDFMRGGRMVEAHASATIIRLGRRIANVLATGWQDQPSRPIASANLKFLITR